MSDDSKGSAVSSWAKIDAALDSHPKIVAAGFWGSVVFQCLIRVNRLGGLNGRLPLSWVSPAYLARLLALDVEANLPKPGTELIELGLSQCVEAGLIGRCEDGAVLICGWDNEWSGPASSAERVRKHRESKRIYSRGGDHVECGGGNGVKQDIVTGNDVTPKRRGEEKRREEISLTPNKPSTNSEARKLAATVRRPAAGLTGWDSINSKKRKLLDTHCQPALALWQLQNELRREVDTTARQLKPTAERLVRVAERLEAGAAIDDCEHVLRVYASEAKSSQSLQWFNGETNWRPDNFARALGRQLKSYRVTQDLPVWD